MKFIYIVLSVLFTFHQAFSQQTLSQQAESEKNNLELSFGSSMLIYQSVLSFQSSTALEAAVRFPLHRMIFMQAGARSSINPAYLEGFARILLSENLESWQPFLGIEVGITNRSKFQSGKKLLSETRSAMDKDISPFYIACQTAPLSFMVWEKWRLSTLEIHIGTHLDNFGRTLRFQVGLFSIGRTL